MRRGFHPEGEQEESIPSREKRRIPSRGRDQLEKRISSRDRGGFNLGRGERILSRERERERRISSRERNKWK
ncbi:hypothetical protein FKM82_025849 [Ascaphus truei]